MIILGVNSYHADAAAALVVDGQLIVAAEEERFCRVKHWAGLPVQAVAACLHDAGLTISQVDHIAINRDPHAHLLKKAMVTFLSRPSLGAIRDRLRNASRIRDIRQALEHALKVPIGTIRAQLHHVEHHRAHLASSFLVSPFESSAVASVDGFGDFVSTMIAQGEGSRLTVLDQITFPHSLGLMYLAITQYLGFSTYGDEYKVMGLAAYGKPEYLPALRRVLTLRSKGRFELNMDFILHHSEGVSMTWEDGAPVIGRVFSDSLARLLGPPRAKNEPVTARHENIAASLQSLYEEAFFHVLNHLYEKTHRKDLCLAGGCALNSVANGQIQSRTPFERVYIPPAPGDAGGAIGAAYMVWCEGFGHPRSFVMDRADWGPTCPEGDVTLEMHGRASEFARAGCSVERIQDEAVLCRKTAAAIAEGNVVGWFQGRMEWGARALGHRSIVADPRRSEMRDILNSRIKKRETFRPFAPSILEETVGDYFEQACVSPFMTMTYRVKPDMQARIPAPTHVDGTCRIQTVSCRTEPLYWQLIKEFERLTSVPMILDTSFNENEPIVCTPKEAVDCFLRTKMDVLSIGPYLVKRVS